MKTWHYILVAAVLLFVWRRNKADGATPPPPSINTIVTSSSGRDAIGMPALNPYGLSSDRRFG